MSKPIQGTARVQITIEIPLSQPWSEDCTLKQMHESAVTEAKEKLIRALSSSSFVCRQVGEAKVLGILTEQP